MSTKSIIFKMSYEKAGEDKKFYEGILEVNADNSWKIQIRSGISGTIGRTLPITEGQDVSSKTELIKQTSERLISSKLKKGYELDKEFSLTGLLQSKLTDIKEAQEPVIPISKERISLEENEFIKYHSGRPSGKFKYVPFQNSNDELNSAYLQCVSLLKKKSRFLTPTK